MKVGIIGSGVVGQKLGEGFIAAGHEVKIGSRDANNEKTQAWAQHQGRTASAGSFADAAKFGDVVVLATLGVANEAALEAAAGVHNLAGKVLIDATNPLKFSDNAPPTLDPSITPSAGERVQATAKDAKVVKCFNTVGNACFYKPDLPGGPPDMLICGNDAAAKKTVDGILREFGWPGGVDLGGIDMSHFLEAMCIVWVRYGISSGGWNHAFKILRK